MPSTSDSDSSEPSIGSSREVLAVIHVTIRSGPPNRCGLQPGGRGAGRARPEAQAWTIGLGDHRIRPAAWIPAARLRFY
eukprot:759574-Hanusia_phi.AAC.15